MSKEGTKITERLQYENEEKKPILNILLIVNNYFKTFNIVSYLVRWHQAAEFTWSFWEASWKAGMESAGSQHIEKTNRQMKETVPKEELKKNYTVTRLIWRLFREAARDALGWKGQNRMARKPLKNRKCDQARRSKEAEDVCKEVILPIYC